ncbi:OVARIAN TUMOR DOMAIN-containing deubiquitinating enzyme 12 [Rosa rugosa]|uniref:OVARIAN TUMOR DOMAIN-containing deubiquitinating enzyme 12 n=1 Tax=Rosa rugosa TaxID=74645 RepID=UPI002B407FD0|nr:OVARIAN TUMOR DOMAIN-containing deubiquitinating enzyme 12 [Rosa rugosa]XP_062001946.1 OVARIAN TUMOR DOMAIN-containing deubiquitinating enzyme 12 [Rosa rugosa]XP_062001947.1 OVARIAN TUMOR DOMAIN-containing deubiquitinating enzyme 12 [Rosa rugosa]
MAGQEHESGIMQWALSLLDGDPAYNTVYYGDMIQHDANDIYRGQYIRGQYGTESNHVENDEIIAHTLQEEYSRLSVADASGYSHGDEEQSQASTHADDWYSLSRRNYCSDSDYPNEGACTVVPSSSCSSPGHLELTDECAVDGEVGWSFNEMMPVPHIPRINGEIPSIDEATSDHQRLLDRLQLYGVVERKVQGDGNCQFSALSDQLYHSPDHHNDVRRKVVNQLKAHPEIYEGYVPMAYDDYLEKMSKSGQWGDHVTLQAAADSYGVKIFVFTSFKDTCCIEILPNVQTSKQVIMLSFWAEVHYNSIYPQEGTPSSDEYRKKKKWWIFGNKN